MDRNDTPITEVVKFFKNIDYDKILEIANHGLEFIKKKAVSGGKETTRMMLELYFVMMSEQTSKVNKFIIGGALAYQLLPNDLLPVDTFGILGYLDNTAVLYWAYKRMKKSVTPEIRQKVDDTLASWALSAQDFTIMKPKEEQL